MASDLIAEAEAVLTAAGQEVRGEVNPVDVARRLAALWYAPPARLCPPPCRPGSSVHETHVQIDGRCCEATERWETRRSASGALVQRRWMQGLACLAGTVVLLAERGLPEFPGPAGLATRVQALAATILSVGYATAPGACAKSTNPAWRAEP